MKAFQVGDKVRNAEGEVGRVYAVRPGMATGTIMYSVRFLRTGKTPGHGFYYEDQIERVENV